MQLSSSLTENIRTARSLLPIGSSFDILTRELYLGETRAYWIGISGLCRTELLQQIFSDLQDPLYTTDHIIRDLHHFTASRIGYSQITFASDWDLLITQLLSGPSLLLVDGFSEALILDVRTYPTRGIDEPDTEKVTRGSRDGFVETLLFNTNLIRRRIRSPRLTFDITQIGSVSRTDIVLAYMKDQVNPTLLNHIRQTLRRLDVTSLTMGSKSLEELLIRKRWYNPLPSIQVTERPDVACSYLTEGYILLLVDNSPSVLILPCTIFHFTQSPEDYYKNPSVGTYFRLVRFVCILASLLLLPVFLLLILRYPDFSRQIGLLTTDRWNSAHLFFFTLAAEFALDLFRYATAHSSSRFSGSLAVIGGLVIGDVAIQMQWVSIEVIFYAAVTLLTTLSLPSIELGDALRLYRIFLLILTGIVGLTGFLIGIILVILSIITTPTIGHSSYFWPLYPFHWDALKTLLFRRPTYLAQPDRTWRDRNR